MLTVIFFSSEFKAENVTNQQIIHHISSADWFVPFLYNFVGGNYGEVRIYDDTDENTFWWQGHTNKELTTKYDGSYSIKTPADFSDLSLSEVEQYVSGKAREFTEMQETVYDWGEQKNVSFYNAVVSSTEDLDTALSSGVKTYESMVDARKFEQALLQSHLLNEPRLSQLNQHSEKIDWNYVTLELDNKWRFTNTSVDMSAGNMSGSILLPNNDILPFVLDYTAENKPRLTIHGAWQHNIAESTAAGTVLDLSQVIDPFLAGDNVSTYHWFYENGMQVESNKVTASESGKFTFDASLAGKKIYCRITNPFLFGFELKTNTTEIVSNPAPVPPTNLKAVPTASRNVNLTWDSVTGATVYQIYWVLADGSERLLKTTDTEYTTARLPNGENTLRVYALAGNLKSDAAEITTTVGTTVTPAVPTNFKASPQASRNVNLTWNTVPGATHYQIYWKNTKGKNVVIGTSETASFTTPRVANGSNTFYVYAWAGELHSKGYATVTTTVGTTVAPTVPTNFKAVPQASRNVNLTWNTVPGATHYQIYWKNTKGKNVVIGTSETASFTSPRVANGSNTFYVYTWAGELRRKGYTTVTTTVGTTVLSSLEAVFVEYAEV